MSCTRHVLNFQWEHHAWRPRVASSETLTAHETDTWARGMVRDYVRCDKQFVCEECGKVVREENCFCDVARAEHCALLQTWTAESQHAPR